MTKTRTEIKPMTFRLVEKYLNQLRYHRWYDVTSVITESVRNIAGMIVTQPSLPHCHLLHHKFHMDWPEIAPGPSRWQTGDEQPRYDTLCSWIIVSNAVWTSVCWYFQLRQLYYIQPAPSVPGTLWDKKIRLAFQSWDTVWCTSLLGVSQAHSIVYIKPDRK